MEVGKIHVNYKDTKKGGGNSLELNQECGSSGLPDSLVVKNLPSNAGDTGSILSQGTKILYASEQLSPCTTAREARALQLLSAFALEHVLCSREALALQLEKPKCHN